MKLWFFRTPHDVYGLSALKPDEFVFEEMDSPRAPLPRNTVYLGGNLPAGYPDIALGQCVQGYFMPTFKPGACIPVELVPVVKTKKARKG